MNQGIQQLKDRMNGYSAERNLEREEADSYVAELHEYWTKLAGGDARRYPTAIFLRQYLTIFSVEDIKSAMEVAMERAGDLGGCLYLTRILRKWKEAGEITV